MQRFNDSTGREWEIAVNIGAIKAVRDYAKVDLYRLFADEAKRVFGDPVLLVDTLWALCKAQAQARQMNETDFAGLFTDGDTLERAATALLEATVDFFPSSRRGMLRATMAKSMELSGAAMTTALERINQLKVTDLLRPTESAA